MSIKHQELTGTSGTAIRGLTNINVIVGRNGAGKSRLLRSLDEALWNDQAFNTRYISPERAGVFQREGSTGTNLERDKNWLPSVRRRNQADNFKAVSAYLLRELEIVYNRRILSTPTLRVDPTRSFENDLLRRISGLLANISVEQENSSFVFVSATGERVNPDQISSGESESIALATEILYFFETLDPDRFNVLLLDEPDVHLHPDLQARLAQFLVTSLSELDDATRDNVVVCIATHSTPFICALAPSPYTSIGTKNFGQMVVQFSRASEQLRKVAPFFGHPLSLSISQDVLLILEGEDDERVWQQAARTSQGKIRVFPVLATSVDQQTSLETFCSTVLTAVFDDPVAYSLRDGDGVRDPLPAIGVVTRFRLQCYAIENTLLTDECLSVLGLTWPAFQEAATAWIAQNGEHKDVPRIRQLLDSTDRLRDAKIKTIRQLICSIAGSKKPWEVIVGQALGSLEVESAADTPSSMLSYLGATAAETLLSVG
ncbi:ATP-binding protein [Pandoraea apista]|nr:ATP-binding protein [Pandoraea apista]RRW99895.1 ATP-binding protein [Pandoraea apista]CFB62721.1 hypothetical protein LMG16407_02795 [Pandoraea apista]